MNTEELLHWNQTTSLWNITDYNNIGVGTYELGQLSELREKLLIKHTRETDEQLEKITPKTSGYLTLLKSRFLTWTEYSHLVESSSYTTHQNTENTNNKSSIKKVSPFAIHYFEMLKKTKYAPLLFESSHHEKNYLELFKIFLPHAKNYFFSERPVPLQLKDLEKHSLITGASGSGKTELMKALFMQIQKHTHEKQQASLVFIDVHGDVTESLMSLRMNLQKPERLMYIDPSFSRNKIPCINPFYHKIDDPVTADLMVQQFCKAFIELMGETGLSMQMEVLLKACIYVLITHGNFGLSDLLDFFDDERNEKLIELGRQTKHHSYRQFFESAFCNKKFALTKLSIYARLQSLLNHYVFYHMLNGKPTIDWEQALNDGKVILINLSKGRIGEQSSIALGKLIIATLLSVTLKRAFQPESKRKACHLMIDEAHNFSTEVFETILKESRKYSLFICLASQSVGSFPVSLRDTVLNNTAVKFLGLNGMPALKVQAGDFGLSYAQLKELMPYEFYLKVNHHIAIKIKSPDFLLKNSKRYFLLSNELKSLKEYILNQSRVYRSIEEKTSEIPKNQKIESGNFNSIQVTTHPKPSTNPNPELSSVGSAPLPSEDSQTKTTQKSSDSSTLKGSPAKYKL